MLNVVNESKEIITGLDSVTIQKWISGIKGGRTLTIDVDFPLSVIHAGHVIITKDGVYKPMPLSQKTTTSGGTTTPVVDEDGNPVYEYSTLPSGYAYAGVLYRSILASKPAASIMINGEVNSETIPYPMTSIKSAFKTACPQIVFIKDEIAE